MSFKYEGFKVGQTIRAHDFEPRAGRGACFLEGRIVRALPHGSIGQAYAHYEVRVTRDVWDGEDLHGERSRIGRLAFVPMESSMDWENRVEAVQS